MGIRPKRPRGPVDPQAARYGLSVRGWEGYEGHKAEKVETERYSKNNPSLEDSSFERGTL
jgi:hypothetical protein